MHLHVVSLVSQEVDESVWGGGLMRINPRAAVFRGRNVLNRTNS